MYLNECCWSGTLREFLAESRESWIGEMKKRFPSVSPYELKPENIRSWLNTREVLEKALPALGEEYGALTIAFEYCMPQKVFEDGSLSEGLIWADAVILSESTAVTLEFKNRPDAIIHHARQAKKYRNRLQKYHDSSRGMRKWAVLIPTQAEDLLDRPLPRVTACSPDRLPEVLREQLGPEPWPFPDPERWLCSEYSVHKHKAHG